MKNTLLLTKIFTFETAHALWGYTGKCKNIHGHSYKLFVTIEGEPIAQENHPQNGMVMDFGDLKKIVQKCILDPFDHALVLNKNTPHKELGKALIKQENQKVLLVDYQPTCEGMILDFARVLQENLPQNVKLAYLKLHETENSYVEWQNK
ncbi:MAG: 6-carboxytetrahydropterin synthase QueD [Flavobacteriaceae bacterium]|nr:MAG: 6-carboxytetrahydropterin synthase QueD [Flavobacteriaceae bacterium]